VNKAHNLEHAIANLDPGAPLTPEQEPFFVERDHSERIEMSTRLRLATKNQQYAHFLFTGHRGSGKGTELYRLNKELADVFCIAHYSVKDRLDVRDLEYTDVVFSIGMGIVEIAQKHDIQVPRKLLEPIINFMAKIYTEIEDKTKEESQVSLQASVLLNLLSGFARYGAERSNRVVVRKELSASLHMLVRAIDDLARHVERSLNKKILVIIEDFDKADLKMARSLFFEHGRSLSDPPVHLIYTFPVALRHTLEFKPIETYFQSFDLPNIKTHNKDNTPVQAGLDKLKEIITRRVADGLFETGTLELLTEKSGGLVRSLISLTNEACLQAIIKKQSKVTIADVNTAIAKERASYARFLTPEQINALRDIHQFKVIHNTQEHQDLLFNLSVLEYRNDDPNPWYDVHPIVQDLL
jgi:hypothetical protein